MKIISIMAAILAISYAFSSHPVLLMIIILAQAIMVCISSFVKLHTSWMAYILFLIFLGGLMVLFIYITSLASNELLALKTSVSSNLATLFFLLVILYIFNFNTQLNATLTFFNFKSIMYAYSWSSSILILTTMIYLLLTLIIVVKVSNKFDAPIKNHVF